MLCSTRRVRLLHRSCGAHQAGGMHASWRAPDAWAVAPAALLQMITAVPGSSPSRHANRGNSCCTLAQSVEHQTAGGCVAIWAYGTSHVGRARQRMRCNGFTGGCSEWPLLPTQLAGSAECLPQVRLCVCGRCCAVCVCDSKSTVHTAVSRCSTLQSCGPSTRPAHHSRRRSHTTLHDPS